MHSTTDTPHYENVPFEIPNSWCWAIGEEIFSPMQSTRPMGISFKYIDIDAIDNTKCKIQQVKTLETKDAPSRATRYTEIGDVLFSMVRPYLRNIAKVTESDCIASTGFFVCSTNGSIVADYCYYLMISDYVVNGLNQFMKGDNSPSINNKHIATWLYPIPPLAEQERIVAGIGKWFALIDQIEQGKVDLQTAIKQTKSKILDLAIHGKLVPQDPNEEPASELLKRINPKAETTCDNGHYQNLPKGWCTTSIKNICDNINGLWKGKKEPFINVGVIRNANFTKDFKLDYSNIEYIDVEQRAFSQRHLKNGDLIIEKSGGSDNYPVGRAILYEGKDELYSFSNFTMILRIRDKNIISSKFLYYYLLDKYKKGVMRTMQTQTTGLHNLILDKYLSMELYIPPYSEQKRIIDAIEELFNKLDAIMESL